MKKDDLPLELSEMHEYGLFDDKNPRSLINLVPAEFQAAMRSLPRKLIFSDEAAVKKLANPSPTLNYLRLNFWLEYNRVQERRASQMNIGNVLRGASHKDYLYEVILRKPEYVAWLITPPADYTVVQADILHSGLGKLREIIDMDLYIRTEERETLTDGSTSVKTIVRPNTAAMAEVRKVVGLLADRVQGSVVQKVAIKAQTTATMAVTDGRGPQTYEPSDIEALTAALNGAAKLLEAGGQGYETIEVIPAPARQETKEF